MPGNKKNLLTKVLALTGTVLLWFPILATVIISLIGSIMERTFLFDYLMPAELFFFAILGGGLLLWAAIRAREKIRQIAICLITMTGLLFGSQGVAVLTGLASGETPRTSGAFFLVISMLIGYTILLIILAVIGSRFVRKIFRSE